MRRSAWFSLPLILLGALAACADHVTAPAPSADDEVDATAEALSFAEQLGLPGTNADRQTGSAPTGTASNPCRYDATSGRWVCAPVTRDGLTFRRSFAYLDADGNPMRRFDRLLTAAVNTRNAVFGTVQRDNALPARIRSEGEMTVSGLLGEETTRILNGREHGTREFEYIVDPQGARSPRRVRVEFANRTVEVVVPVVARSADGSAPARQWPLSGQTIRAHAATVTYHDGETDTNRWRETTTFNGTAIVPVEIVSSRGTRICERNLETGTLSCGER